MALNIEPYGDYVQSIAYCFSIFEPKNGSWMQAVCESNGITEPYNGSWELAYAYYFYTNFYTGPAEDFEIKNGSYWQTICYYFMVEAGISEFLFIDGINYPINGSWENNFFQLVVITEAGGSIPMPA